MSHNGRGLPFPNLQWSFSIWEPRSHPFRIFIAIIVVLPMPNGLLLLHAG
jgi:hypothetical protein